MFRQVEAYLTLHAFHAEMGLSAGGRPVRGSVRCAHDSPVRAVNANDLRRKWRRSFCQRKRL